MKKGCLLLFAITVLLSFSGTSNADLTTIGTANYLGTDYNLIYEDDNINGGLVWLDYTKSPDSWQNQVDWASGLGGNLMVNLDPGYTTTIDWSTGWRLPIVDESKANMSIRFGYEGPDQNGYHDYQTGYNMVNSELGHLYYESLGNKGYYSTDGVNPQAGYGLQNTGHFNNLVDGYHWSGTEWSPVPGYAWGFNFITGLQIESVKYNDDGPYAIAVHPGDVSAIPDNCPNDPNKTDPGLCGCGTPDTDTDTDGTPDCIDSCPNDLGKIEPGICGCGIADTDSDGDGFAVCNDCNDSDYSINPDACDIKKDGIDQDCDGFDRTKGKPCAASDEEPSSKEGPAKTCNDGIDNDDDGYTDCDDSDCAKKKNCQI